MEQNLPVLAKKVWRLVRVIYFMLRKNISKSKLFIDLHKLIIKRRKIAGKSVHNLMHHHHHHSPPPSGDYEFSCTTSPSTNHHPFSLFQFRKKQHDHYNSGKKQAEGIDAAVLMKAMEMIYSETSSPALPGFGRSPVVRQLRVTDSPFPVSGVDEDDSRVDEAAEEFISRFYDDLRRQN